MHALHLFNSRRKRKDWKLGLYASLFSSLQVLCLDLCALTLGPVEGMLW
jgi:hypothetical protein